MAKERQKEELQLGVGPDHWQWWMAGPGEGRWRRVRSDERRTVGGRRQRRWMPTSHMRGGRATAMDGTVVASNAQWEWMALCDAWWLAWGQVAMDALIILVFN